MGVEGKTFVPFGEREKIKWGDGQGRTEWKVPEEVYCDWVVVLVRGRCWAN